MSSADRTRAELIEALGVALRDVSGQGVIYGHAVAARLGVAPTDLECLGYLQDGPLTAGALAEATRLTSGAVTGVIDRLERAGYAQREADPADRRKVLVRMTHKATHEIGPLYGPMARSAVMTLGRYTDAELALVLDFLERSRDGARGALEQLNAGPEPAPPPNDAG